MIFKLHACKVSWTLGVWRPPPTFPGALSQAIWGICILNKLPGDCKCRWSPGQPDSANTNAGLSALSCRRRGSPALASTFSSLSPDIASAFTSESLSGVPTTFFLSWSLSSEMVLGGQISLNQSEVSFLFLAAYGKVTSIVNVSGSETERHAFYLPHHCSQSTSSERQLFPPHHWGCVRGSSIVILRVGAYTFVHDQLSEFSTPGLQVLPERKHG